MRYSIDKQETEASLLIYDVPAFIHFRKGFLSPQSRCSLRSTNRSRCDVDHIGWGHSPRAELEARVRTLGGGLCRYS